MVSYCIALLYITSHIALYFILFQYNTMQCNTLLHIILHILYKYITHTKHDHHITVDCITLHLITLYDINMSSPFVYERT